MYGPELQKWDVPGAEEFIQNLLITTEAKQYDQYDEMLINIQSKNIMYDMMYAWLYYTSSQRKNFATQTMAIYRGSCGGTIRTLTIYTSSLLWTFPT